MDHKSLIFEGEGEEAPKAKRHGEKIEIPPPEDVEREIHKSIVGQDGAVKELARLYTKIRSGVRLSKTKPIDSIFLAGPSGVGKTESVIALAKMLIETMPEENMKSDEGDERDEKKKRQEQTNRPKERRWQNESEVQITESDALTKIVKLDGGNFQFGHEIASLLGSPHGYLGFDTSKGLLHSRTLERHKIKFKDFRGREQEVILILLDEAEKGHEKLHNAFLAILDKGRLTLGDNSVTDLSNAVIFFTSNVGNVEVERSREHGIGFKREEISPEREFSKSFKKIFRPEYRGRINKTIVFEHLRPEDLRRIVDLQLTRIEKQFRTVGIDLDLEVTPAAKEFFVRKGHNLSEGARAMVRVMEDDILDQLVMASRHYVLNDRVVVADVSQKEEGGQVEFYFGDTKEAKPKQRKATAT